MSFNDLAKLEAARKKAAEERDRPKAEADTEETPRAGREPAGPSKT